MLYYLRVRCLVEYTTAGNQRIETLQDSILKVIRQTDF